MQRTFASSSSSVLRRAAPSSSRALQARCFSQSRVASEDKADARSETHEGSAKAASGDAPASAEQSQPAESQRQQRDTRQSRRPDSRREALYDVLMRQRRRKAAEEAAAMAPASDAAPRRSRDATAAKKADEMDSSTFPAQSSSRTSRHTQAPRPGRRGSMSRDSTGRPQRVDLYLNETGYPQARPAAKGHETEELHAKRREHLAPHPPDEAFDALSAFVDDGDAHASVAKRGHTRRPNQRSPAGPGSQQARRPEPFATPRPGGPSDRTALRGPARGPTGSKPLPQRGPGGQRGPNTRAGGPAHSQKRPSGPPRSLSRKGGSKGQALQPSKPFGPAPTSVVSKNGQYSLAPLLPEQATNGMSNVIKATHQSQLQAMLAGLEKKGKKKPTKGAVSDQVLRGDWEKYVEPLFAKANAAGGKTGKPAQVRDEVMSSAKWALARNGSISLAGKMQLSQKLEASI